MLAKQLLQEHDAAFSSASKKKLARLRFSSSKAEKEGLELMPGTNSSLIDAFYDPFAVNMRDLGSPVHGRGFFGAMVDATGSYGLGWLVTAAVVAIGVLLLAFGFRERER